MSDQSQGPGWWLASDGKWYPPETAPGVAPEAPPTQPVGATPGPESAPPTGPAPATPPAPSRSGLGAGPIIAIVVAAVAVIAAIVFFATKDDGGDKKSAAATSSSSSSSSTSRSSSSPSSLSRASRSSSSRSSGAPQIDAPPGYTAFSDDEDQFGIAVPDRLQVIDLTSADLDQVIQQLSENNPKLAELGPQIKQVFQNGGKLFAIDALSGGAFNDNLNIIATPGSVDVTSPATKSQVESQLSAIGATDVSFDSIETPAGPALTSSYTATVNSSDGMPITFSGRQALVSAGGKLWFITYSAGADDSEGFGTMLRSFDVS